MVTTQVNPQSF